MQKEISVKIYTITWILYAFSLVVARDLLEDYVIDLFFYAPKSLNSLNKHYEFYCMKQTDSIFSGLFGYRCTEVQHHNVV